MKKVVLEPVLDFGSGDLVGIIGRVPQKWVCKTSQKVTPGCQKNDLKNDKNDPFFHGFWHIFYPDVPLYYIKHGCQKWSKNGYKKWCLEWL